MSQAPSILHWLDLHRQSYFWLAAPVISIAFIWAATQFLREAKTFASGHDWRWSGLMTAILPAGRKPVPGQGLAPR